MSIRLNSAAFIEFPLYSSGSCDIIINIKSMSRVLYLSTFKTTDNCVLRHFSLYADLYQIYTSRNESMDYSLSHYFTTFNSRQLANYDCVGTITFSTCAFVFLSKKGGQFIVGKPYVLYKDKAAVKLSCKTIYIYPVVSLADLSLGHSNVRSNKIYGLLFLLKIVWQLSSDRRGMSNEV